MPIKQVGPNKRVGWVSYVNILNNKQEGWIFYVNILNNKQVGPNKRVGWREKALNLKWVGLKKVERVERCK